MFFRSLPRTVPYRLGFIFSIGLLVIFAIYSFGLPNVRNTGTLQSIDISNRIKHSPNKGGDATEIERATATSASDSTIEVASSVLSSISTPTISLASSVHVPESLESNSSTAEAEAEAEDDETVHDAPPDISKMLVVAGMKEEDYSWVHDHLPEWESIIYYSDDVTALHHIPVNKGREAAVYLTYIIENYHNLRNVTGFVHATRAAWHNDFGLFHQSRDLVDGLRNLRTEYVISQGYANLRCIRDPGCFPLSVPLNDMTDHRDSLNAFRKAYPLLHPGSKLPDEIGSPCCAQFVVSRDQILARPRSDFERYYKWLMETDTSDWDAGWIFEYTWHIIFGRASVDCGSTEESCSCNLYGWCLSGKERIERTL